MKKEYGESFSQGTLYLSTFDSIRRHESGQYIADKDEGKGSYYTDELIISHSDNPDEQEIIQRLNYYSGIRLAPDCVGTEIRNCRSDVVNKNAYMFCLTTERNDKEWLEKEGYDSCFSIEMPPQDLGQQISDKLMVRFQKPIRSWYGQCLYQDRLLDIKDEKVNCDPKVEYVARYFRKPYDYFHQKEYRIVFLPGNELSLSNVSIKCPEITSYISHLF
jgi:hypothetical protein